MKEKIEMLMERLNEYSTFCQDENDDDFDRGYSKGWKNAFNDAIMLVELYLKEGEKND